MFYSRLHIPLSLGAYQISQGIFDYNCLKTWIVLKLLSSGHLKRNKENILAASQALGYSTRTIQAHIDYLVRMGFINFNEKSGTLFLNGFNKMCRKYRLDPRRAVSIGLNEIKNLKLQLFSTQILFKTKAHNSFLRSDAELSKLKKSAPEPMQTGRGSNRGAHILLVNGYQDYAGVSCDVARKGFNRSRMWSSRMKKQSKLIGIMNYKKVVKVLAESDCEINQKGAAMAFPEVFHKTATMFSKGKYLLVERMADLIETSVVSVRKKAFGK